MRELDKKKIFWKKVDGETVILNTDNAYYYTLDEVGSLIWEMLAKGQDSGTIAACVAAEYDVSPKEAQDDIEALLRKLEKEELIKK